MEAADPHPARTVARPGALQQLRGAAAHFRRRLVGEGDREDAVRGHAVDLVQPGDAMGQHPGLAGTGAREHQVMASGRGDGLALGRVQPIEQVGDIHPAIMGGTDPFFAQRQGGLTPVLAYWCSRLLLVVCITRSEYAMPIADRKKTQWLMVCHSTTSALKPVQGTPAGTETNHARLRVTATAKVWTRCIRDVYRT